MKPCVSACVCFVPVCIWVFMCACLCVYMCTCMCVYVSVCACIGEDIQIHMCACTRRSEDNLGRNSSAPSIVSVLEVFHWASSQQARLTGKPWLSTCLCPPQHRDYNYTLPHPSFLNVGSAAQTQTPTELTLKSATGLKEQKVLWTTIII